MIRISLNILYQIYAIQTNYDNNADLTVANIHGPVTPGPKVISRTQASLDNTQKGL